MMSPENKSLLDKHRTKLMEDIDLDGSTLLDELLQRNALRPQQLEVIKVKQSQPLLRHIGLGLSLLQVVLEVSMSGCE